MRGVAESIHYVTSGAVEREAKQVIRSYPVGEGDVYIAGAYNLPAKWVVHGVTMMRPGSRSNLETMGRCVESVLTGCRSLNAYTVALPLLGTGTGGLNVRGVAGLYKRSFEAVGDLEIVVVRF